MDPERAEQERTPRRYALVVGVNTSTKMQAVLPTLQAAQKNALSVAQALQDQGEWELVQPPLLGEQVSTSALRDALKLLAQQRNDEDTLLFYFSGHGYLIEDESQERQVYLATHDFSAQDVLEGEDMDAISLGWLQERLYKHTKAGQVLLILDCCYAGNAGHLAQDLPLETLTDLLKTVLGNKSDTTRGKYRMTLAATAHDQNAYERDGYGVMTFHLLNALQGEYRDILDDDGHLTVGRLHDGLYARMPKDQKPSLSGDTAGRDVLLARIEHPLREVSSLYVTDLHQRQERLLALYASPEGERFLQSRLQGFVGRRTELETIREHIRSLQSTGGYLVIQGQAGQGKSSIIAKLIATAHATASEREEIPFHFIRFHPGPDYQVTLLQNLMARLIRKYHLSDIYLDSDQRAALRDFFFKVLQEVSSKEGRETIYIDGLDQLEEDVPGYGSRDLSFLPQNPPVGIVFVLGTRPDDTLAQLHLLKPLITYPLPSFRLEDFHELLRSRQVHLDRHLVEQCYIRMQKHALYLDLVAKELYEQRQLDTQAIEGLFLTLVNNPNNIFSYTLERLKRQREIWRQIVKPILGILLTAQQPLTFWQLRTVLQLESDQLHEGLQRLGGLVDTTGQQYSLYHLKLQEFLRHGDGKPETIPLFSSDEEEAYHARWVQWCEQTSHLVLWQESPNPAEQSRRVYAQQHYVTHLYAAHFWERLFALLDEHVYGQAKEHYDVQARSYVQDLKKGGAAASSTEWSFEEGLAQLSRLWKYTLLRCRLRSTADNYPLTLFQAMLLMGKEREVMGLVELLTDPHEQAQALLLLARHFLAQKEREQKGLFMIMRAEHVASSISNPDKHVVALQTVAKTFAQQHLWEQAEHVAFSIPASVEQAEVLVTIARSLAEAGEREHALLLLEKAEHIASSIPNLQQQTKTLSAIAQLLAGAGEQEHALLLLNHAERIASSISNSVEQAEGLRAVAEILAQQHLWEKAEHIASSIPDPQQQAKALSTIAQLLAEAGKQKYAQRLLERAEYIASSISHSYQQGGAFRAVAETLAQQHCWEQAEHFASSIRDPYHRAQTFITIAQSLAEAGKQKYAQRLLERAEHLASIPDPFLEQQNEVLRAVIEALAQQHLWEQAEHFASSISNASQQAEALSILAQLLAEVGEQECALLLLNHAEHIASSISYASQQAEALRAIAEAFAQQHRWEQAEYFTSSIADPYHQAQAFIAIAQSLVKAGEEERALLLLNHAERIASSISYSSQQAEALQAVAQALTQQHCWEQAKYAAASITNPSQQAQAFIAIAQSLVKAGEHEHALLLLNHAEHIASSISNSNEQGRALQAIVRALAQQHCWEQAKHVATSISSPYQQADGLYIIARFLTQQHLWEQAEYFAFSMSDPSQQARILSTIAQSLAKVGEQERALQLLEDAEHLVPSTDDSWINKRSETLRAIAEAFARQHLWERAKHLVPSILNPSQQAQTLITIAQSLADAGQQEHALQLLNQAEQVAFPFPDDEEETWALPAVVEAFARQHLWDQVERIAFSMPDSFGQVEILIIIAQSLAETGEREHALQFLERAEHIASSITHYLAQAGALRAVAEAFAQQHFWNQAERVVFSILDAHQQVRALNTLKSLLVQEQRYTQLLRLVQNLWQSCETTELAFQLFPYALELIEHAPTLGGELANAFQWVDNFFNTKES